MATPSGQIAFSQVNAELGVSPTSTQANLGSAPFRGLAGVPSGQISMSNLQGKSSFSVTSSGTLATPSTGLAPGNGYIYHTFTGPGTFTVTGSKTMEILLVGGGGGSGPTSDSRSGGAGGGGVVYWSAIPITAGSYSVTVGAGGGYGPGQGQNGGDSSFGPSTPVYVVALGGGRAGGGPRNTGRYNANPGGSGGGGGGFDPQTSPGAGIQPSQNAPLVPQPGFTQYGNPGGPDRPDYSTAEGGGGASQAGNAGGTTTYGGKGGNGVLIAPGPTPGFYGTLIGIPAIAPINGYYGGGGDSNYYPNSAGRPLGGGGTSPAISSVGDNGVNYTGGGAGGSGGSPALPGATGGSGIVVIRYLAS